RRIGHDRDKCIILSTHILPEVEVTCDRAIIINEGKIIAEGTTAELTGLARGSDIYHVGVVGNRNLIESAFTGLKWISNFKVTSDDTSDRSTYQITASSDRDVSEEIFDCAVSKGFKLTELRRDTAKLEDIFHTLTTKEVG
ncbi:MAG: ABC transporter, partial [bacterium]